MPDSHDEQLMTRFLLGVPLAERAEIEERLIADPAYFESLCALEDELILRWHRDELSSEERRRFAEAYLASPARRARVEGAGRVIATCEDLRSQHVRHLSVWQHVARWLDARSRSTQLVLAGSAAALIAALPLSIYLAAQLWTASPSAPGERSLAVADTDAAPLVVAFSLAPGPLRGDAEGTNRLRVPAAAGEILLQFEVADPGDAPLDAVLLPLEGHPIEQPGSLQTARRAGVLLVTLAIAPNRLIDGDYVLALRTRDRTGNLETIATRWFRVVHE